MRQAELPEDMEGHAIGGMMEGEAAYTVPWAMWVDERRRCWLHPKYAIDHKPGGTVQMRIERRRDGYHVWPPRDARYEPHSDPGYVGCEGIEWVPVAELHPDPSGGSPPPGHPSR